MFFHHTALEGLKNAMINSHFGSVFEENSGREKCYYRDAIIFEKLRFQNVFCPRENERPAFSNSSGLKSAFEKLRFRDA